jgi:hypothetical protein
MFSESIATSFSWWSAATDRPVSRLQPGFSTTRIHPPEKPVEAG